jgi:hypothetical protein
MYTTWKHQEYPSITAHEYVTLPFNITSPKKCWLIGNNLQFSEPIEYTLIYYIILITSIIGNIIISVNTLPELINDDPKYYGIISSSGRHLSESAIKKKNFEWVNREYHNQNLKLTQIM